MSNITATVNNVSYPVHLPSGFNFASILEARDVLTFTVIDAPGTASFQRGMPVIFSDTISGTLYNGYVQSDSPKKLSPDPNTTTVLHTITCMDNEYNVDKRSNEKDYTEWNAGDIFVDMVQNGNLAAEGISVASALRHETTTADFNTGTLNGTAGNTSTPTNDGDLELTQAGSTFTLTEATSGDFSSGTLTNMQSSSAGLQPTTVNALKLQTALSFAYGVEFAQSQQTVSGNATGTASGNATGTVSGTATGSTSGTVNSSASYTPGGSISIFGGNPGETASFSGNFSTISSTGTYSDFGVNVPFSTFATLGFSTPISSSFSTNVTPMQYTPKYKSKVSVDGIHYVVVSVDQAVADNRLDATIWTGSMVVGSNDTLNYDIWISSTSPAEEAGIDLQFNDGTVMTEYLGTLDNNTDVGVWDQNRVSISPIQDMSDDAKDAWYTRQVDLSILSGKTITAVSMFCAGNIAGTYTVYVKNCYLGSHSGSPFFGTAQSAPTTNPPTVTSIGSYIDAATIVTVAPVYLPASSSRISPSHSIAGVGLVKDSIITWQAVNPITGPAVVPNSPGSAQTAGNEAIYVSYDGATWLPCTNNAPLPGLPAGANTSGLSLYLMEAFAGGQDPTAIPTLQSVAITIHSAPNATTSDIVSIYGNTSQWNTGTMLGTAPNGSGNLALGKTTYSWSNLNNMTFTGGNTSASTPTQSVSGGAYVITTASLASFPTNAWSDTRFNFVSAAKDFTLEADFTLNGGSSPYQNEIGFLYRQTYWGNPNNSFAYYVRIMQFSSGGSVTLGYGINNPPTAGSTSGTYTYVTSPVSVTIANNTTYHMKVVVGANRHTVYWNNGTTPIIDVLDNTYTAAGNIGVRTYGSGLSSNGVNKIANFSITNTFAGTWTSPSINLNSLGTCGNSQVSWSELTSAGTPLSSTLVLASLDGGSTWKQCTNGSVSSTANIPGLTSGTNVTGKSLLIQMILNSTGFLSRPIIDGLYIRVCGSYPGSSGTRTTAPYGIDSMTRANQSGWGTAQDTQAWAKSGTGTDAISSNTGTITNTTGDVYEHLGSKTGTDMDETTQVEISASTILAGMTLRWSNTSNYYKLALSTTGISIIKNTGGGEITLATTAGTFLANTWYYLRFRATGQTPVNLYGKIWAADGATIEPGVSNGFFSRTNPQWTVVATD